MFRSVLAVVLVAVCGPRCPADAPSAPDGPRTVDATAAGGDAAPADATSEAAASAADSGAIAEVAAPTAEQRLDAAVAAFAAQRWDEAEAGFRATLGVWPAIDDIVRYGAMEAARRAGDLDAARTDAEALIADHAAHARDAALCAADIAFAQQRWADAAAAYAALGDGIPRRADRTAAHFRLGRCREELGDARGAQAIYEALVRQEPDQPAADDAATRLQALDPSFAIPPAWRLERARVLVRRRQWARAIAELDLIPADTRRPSPEQVAWERANAVYAHRRRYDEAAEAFAAIAAQGGSHAVDAEFLHARSLARANHDDEAIAAYREFARRHPDDGHAADARQLAAGLELQLGRFDDAIKALEAIVGRRRTGPGHPQARWSLGFAYLLADRPADALDVIDHTAADDDDPYSEARATYWGAVARLALDRRDEAVQKLRAVIAGFPLQWYSMLARQRLAGLGIDPPPPYPERTVGRSDLRERCDGLPPEAGVLLRAGLEDDARTFALPGLRPRIAAADGDELRDLVGTLLCLDAVDLVYAHVGAAHQQDWGLRLDPAALPYWEAAYPRAWRAQVESAAKREGMSPYLIWAIMRQESAFDPDAVSQADAIGLLQMIPPTTTRMLEARGETYDDGVLLDPDRNIALGTEYIARIGEKFGGQLPLQAAGFNAGPHNVARWLDGLDETRLDCFVERIPFGQTRNYVRRVLTAYARYLFLYETDDDTWPVELPLELQRDYLPEPSY